MKNNGIRKVTMSDVARQSGVDLSTVSRVLNHSFKNHTYAPETVKRVRDEAKNLGYQPSLAARSLRTGKTMLLGVVVSDISNSFFGELASSLDACSGKSGYRLIISNTNEDPARQTEHIDGMLAHRVDGLIVSPSGNGGLDKAIQAGVPVVTIDRPLPNSGFPFVGLDNLEATRLLSSELKARGYQNIGIVVQEGRMDLTLQERLDGLRAGLKTEGCNVSWIAEIPRSGGLQNEARQEISEKLGNGADLLDAVVGLNNSCTTGLIEVLEDLGLAWGDSLGLAGIDDFNAASLVRPAITVVRQPIERIATEAFSILLKQMKNPQRNLEDSTVLIDPIWMERESLPERG